MTTQNLSKITTIEDLRRMARFKIPKMFYDYVASGSWTETTLRANSQYFHLIKLIQKVLVNMSDRILQSTMIGRAFFYDLGAYGEDGVRRALEIIYNEMDSSMAFCSHTDIKNVGKEILLPGSYPEPGQYWPEAACVPIP